MDIFLNLHCKNMLDTTLLELLENANVYLHFQKSNNTCIHSYDEELHLEVIRTINICRSMDEFKTNLNVSFRSDMAALVLKTSHIILTTNQLMLLTDVIVNFELQSKVRHHYHHNFLDKPLPNLP